MTSLRRCTRVGVNLTWRCNWSCKTCFYRYNDSLHTPFDYTIDEVTIEMTKAKARGCNHVVAVGYGEPMLYPYINDFVTVAKNIGLKSSIITNGSVSVSSFEKLYELGLNHLHISVHDLDERLDAISGVKNSGKKQAAVKEFLRDNKLPWRSNTTLQSRNYDNLENITLNVVENGVFHVVLLGFLPHYEWSDKSKADEVVVPPDVLRPYIEKACDSLLEAKRLFTIRYHPMCHLSPRLWKYVVNAKYVLHDPWEWEYGHSGESDTQFKISATKLGNECSIKTEPCTSCVLYLHCGGWNGTNVKLCNVQLKSIRVQDVPDEYKEVINIYGGLHMLNPANNLTGSYDETIYTNN